jgi:type IX secretion system PorP/SprF family membrane protein
LLLAWLAIPAQGQQIPLFSQYMFHDIALNPATAGNKKYWSAKAFNRNQWLGIDGAPVTQVVSAQGPLKYVPMALGGSIYNDMIGPMRQTGINMVYSYWIRLNRTTRIAGGISGGLFQYQFDPDKMITHEPDDAAVIQAGEGGMFVPDASFGLFLYNPRFYIGISTNHLFEFDLKLGELERATIGHLSRHYYLNMGYNITFKHANQFEIEPSVLAKYVIGSPLSLDGTLKFYYKDAFWWGGTYRSDVNYDPKNEYWVDGKYQTQDAIVAMAGFRVTPKIYVGYAYEMTTTALASYSDGSHEIMVGMDMFKEKREKLSKEDRMDERARVAKARDKGKRDSRKAKEKKRRVKEKAKAKKKR